MLLWKNDLQWLNVQNLLTPDVKGGEKKEEKNSNTKYDCKRWTCTWLETLSPPPTWTWGGFKNLPLSRGKHLGVGGESGAKLRDNGVECCNHCCSGTGHTQPGIDSQREGRGAGAVGGCQPLARVIWLHCTSHHTTSPLPHVLHVQPAPSRVKKRPAQCGVFSYQNTHKLALQKNNKKKERGPRQPGENAWKKILHGLLFRLAIF